MHIAAEELGAEDKVTVINSANLSNGGRTENTAALIFRSGSGETYQRHWTVIRWDALRWNAAGNRSWITETAR